MAFIDLRVSVEDANIAKLRRKQINIDLVLDKATAVVLNNTRTRFRKMVDPDNKPWKPSKAARIRQAGGYTWSNGKRVTGGQTLFATGRLFHSIYAYKIGPRVRGVGVPNRIQYARFHQTGTKRMPKRQFLGVGAKDIAEVRSKIRQLGDRVFKK